MKLIDTHAHLDSFQKEGKLAEVLANAKENNVERIIACSTTPSDWILYSEMSAQNQNIFWQAGIHPTEIAENDDIALDALSSLFIENKKHSAPVAIGEIGLDFYRLPNDEEEAEKIKKRQREIFGRQLRIAADFNLKVCVHARESLDACVEEIEKSRLNFANVVFHCYSGSAKQLLELNERGARASFTGIITYKNADEMRKAMLAQGLETVMLETDCPYLAPVPYRGQVCEPAMLSKTCEAAAEIFGVDKEYLADASTNSAESFFAL